MSFEEVLSDFPCIKILSSYTRPGCEGHPKLIKETMVRFYAGSPPVVVSDRNDVIRHVFEHMRKASEKKTIVDMFSNVRVGFYTTPKVRDTFSFGNGSDDAIEGTVIIRVSDHEMGLAAEYQYLTEKFGRRGIDWELEGQALLEYNGRPYDELRIKLSDGNKKTIIFDLTEFFGKWVV